MAESTVGLKVGDIDSGAARTATSCCPDSSAYLAGLLSAGEAAVRAVSRPRRRSPHRRAGPLFGCRSRAAALLDCGLILRRDSPNGKRYARKGREGDFEEAFGFSLAPLLARADEFQEAAECVRAESRALKLMSERITLYRRDIGKLHWPGLQWRRAHSR